MEYKLNRTHIRAREARQVGQCMQTFLRSCWKVKCGANQYGLVYINRSVDGWLIHAYTHTYISCLGSSDHEYLHMPSIPILTVNGCFGAIALDIVAQPVTMSSSDTMDDGSLPDSTPTMKPWSASICICIIYCCW